MHALTLNTSALFSNTSARNMQVHLHNACTGALVLIQIFNTNALHSMHKNLPIKSK